MSGLKISEWIKTIQNGIVKKKVSSFILGVILWAKQYKVVLSTNNIIIAEEILSLNKGKVNSSGIKYKYIFSVIVFIQ